MDDIVIKVDGVSKNFVLPHEKVSTVKGLFTQIYKKKKKSSEVQHALKDINFEVKQGEFFGIVGRNGSGKSTMLKILAGIYQPTRGAVKTRGKLVPFIELGVGFNPELTGKENVYLNGAMLGFSVKDIDAMYNEIVTFAELERFMDQKLKNYSSGMQVRLAFSMAIRSEADILLIDEVLAVGDADFQRKCYEYFKRLKKNKTTVVFVSHDMGAVREFCDRAVLIEKNEVKSIGDTRQITEEYSQLFMDELPAETSEPTGKRWGSGSVQMKHVKASVEDDYVRVRATLDIKDDLDKVIYGVHINSQDGGEITAMNNRMVLLPDMADLQKGTKLTLEWKMLNVFNDGKYFVTLTFIDDVANTLDWWIDATSFTVKRVARSTTPILPPVEATFNKEG